jgi:hypothetical protein
MSRSRDLGALAAVTALGLWLRAQGLSDVGLWRDDAWVALTSRVDVATAWRMGVTAPGFTLVERAWILVHPGSSRWDQLLPLVHGAQRAAGRADLPVTELGATVLAVVDRGEHSGDRSRLVRRQRRARGRPPGEP